MRLTNQFSVMGRKYDLAFGQANTWKRKLKNDKYELIENAIDKLGQLEDIEDWFDKKTFYGKATNEPNKILELKFEKLDFRPEEDLLLIHFKVLNSWATNIFYNILNYGKTWALTKTELMLSDK